MALIIRRVLIVFPISSFEFTKSNCCDFIAKNEWPLRPQSTGLRFGGNAKVLLQAATEAKYNSWV